MIKYIDADKLIAEIKRLKDKYPSWQLKLAMDDLCDFIATLQQEQPEVDLEEEIDAVWNPRFNLGWDEKSLLSINHSAFETIARHFYELGLNAKRNSYERPYKTT